MTDIQAEFGSDFPVRFLDMSQARMFDSEGKEVPYPQCSECGTYKQQVIGKTHSAWICPIGCPEYNSPAPLKSYKVKLHVEKVEEV